MHPYRAVPLRSSLFALLIATSFPPPDAAAYEGFGAGTVGGSGGEVIHVTNLDNSGAGSLRDALSAGSREVVFDVSGDIVLTSAIELGGSFITIAGETAPGEGITLRGAGLRITDEVGHVIVRHIRIRNPSGDGITIRDGAHDVVVDHVSIDGCGDGNVDVTRDAHDVTVSWSILSNCAKNMLIKFGAERVTVHHNLFVDSVFRNPFVSHENDGTPAGDTTADVRNNLVWNWGEGAGTGVECGAKANVVANYYSSPASDVDDQRQAITVSKNPDCKGQAFTSLNKSGDPVPLDLNALGTESDPFPAAPVATQSACDATQLVLGDAGAFPRDALDGSLLAGVSAGCVCGGSIPCACGDRLLDDRKLGSEDPVAAAPCSSAGLVVDLPGLTLDLGGRTISGSGSSIGILVDAPDVRVENGDVVGFETGLLVTETAEDAILEKIDSGLHSGSGAVVLADGATVASSSFDDNAVDGLLVESDGNALLKNRCKANGERGIRVEGDDSHLTRNRCDENGGSGIKVRGDDNVFVRNKVKKNGKDGLDVNGSGNELERNTAKKNERDGVIVTGGGNHDLGRNKGRKNGGIDCSIDGNPC